MLWVDDVQWVRDQLKRFEVSLREPAWSAPGLFGRRAAMSGLGPFGAAGGMRCAGWGAVVPRRVAAIEAVAVTRADVSATGVTPSECDWRVGRAGEPSAASRRKASGDSGRRLSDRRDSERSEWRGGRAGPLAASSGVGRNRRTFFGGSAQRPRGSGTPLPLDERGYWRPTGSGRAASVGELTTASKDPRLAE